MSFEPKNKAEIYSPKDGDTLESIAEVCRSQGNDISALDIAEYNWQVSDKEEINRFLRDELGARRRYENNSFVLQSDDEPRSKLLIPKRFKKEGLSFNKTHSIKVSLKTPVPPQLLNCHSISGVYFDYNQSFLYPEAASLLESFAGYAEQEESKLMLFGHTDDTGDKQDNKALSLRRAQAVFAVLTGNAEMWEKNSFRESWGLNCYQIMLKFLGNEYDPGNAHGGDSPENKLAIEKFQTDFACSVSGDLNDETKSKIITEYINKLFPNPLSENSFTNEQVMGCADFNPIAEVKSKNEYNRRVTIYVFHEQRIPNFPCRALDPLVCDKQIFPDDNRFTKGFSCSFYDSLGEDCACDGQSYRVQAQICEWEKLEIQCSHKRILDVVSGSATQEGDHVLQVVSFDPDLEKINGKFTSGCQKGKGAECASMELLFQGKPKKFVNHEDYVLKAPELNKSDIKFVDFFTKYIIPIPTSFDPDIYTLTATNCEGEYKRNIKVEVFPKIKWNGNISFGYKEPTAFSQQVNHEVGMDKLKDQGRWSLAGNIELELGEHKYKYGVEAKEPETEYFPELKKSLSEAVSFFSDIKGELLSKSNDLVDFKVDWPNVMLSGGVELAESKSSHRVGAQGEVSLKMNPLFAANVKTDLLDWILRVASVGYGEFIRKVRESAEKGLVSSQLEGKAVLGIILSTKGSVDGELSWKKNVDTDWVSTTGDKLTTVKASLGMKLEGKVEAKGKIFFVSFGMGAAVSIQGASSLYEEVGVIGQLKAGINNGSPVIEGSLVFTGAAIYYTYYAELGVKTLTGEKRNKNMFKRKKSGLGSKKKSGEIKKENKKELIQIFREYEWPKVNAQYVVLNSVKY